MRLGKLSSEELAEMVLSETSVKHAEILQSAGVAEDCSAIKSKDILLLTTDPITATGSNAGRLAITVSANDIAVSGGTPLCCLLTVIAPPDGTVAEIAAFMREAHAAADALNVDIIGGHTEFSAAVNKMVVNCTMLGTAKKIVKTCGAQAGDKIILTKTAAVEATAIMANDYEAQLLKGGMTVAEVAEAKAFIDKISVLDDAKTALQFTVNSMHDVTEGGIYGAVAELAEAANLGATLYADKIPVAEVTAKICKILGVSPMRLIGSGSVLIVSPQAENVVAALNARGINACVIGEMHRKKEIVAIGGSGTENLSVEPDELLLINK